MEEGIRSRLDELARRLRQLPDSGPPAVRRNLAELGQTIEGSVPRAPASYDRWNELRLQLLRGYESLAASLRVESIHVPSLRPSNLTRNVFHVVNGAFVVALLRLVDPGDVVWLAAGAAGLAWSMETARRVSARVNALLMRLFARVAHPHERWRVNSATWYTTSLLVLALFAPARAALLGVVVLSVSDPIAALVGRRFGRHSIRAGRSVEGSFAFVLSGALAGLAVLTAFHPELGLGPALVLASASALVGAAVELLSIRVDDNVSIPVCVAAVAALLGRLLGV